MVNIGLKAQELKRLGDDPEIPYPEFEFYCVVCKGFRFGSASCSFTVGGWHCPNHPKIEMVSDQPPGE